MKKATILGKCLNIAASARRSVNVKANEFVKKFGLEHTKYLIEDTELSEFAIHSSCAGKYSMDTVSTEDLKRLVESHDLIKDYYGLTRAKEYAESNYTAPEIKDALKQAIADVESCQ